MRHSLAGRAGALVRSLGSVVLILLLSACEREPADSSADRAPAGGQAADAAGPSGPENACALLPAADVGRVLGEPVTDSLALSMPDGGPTMLSQCNYSTATVPAAVSLALRRSAAGVSPSAGSDGVRQSLVESGVQVENVAGLGELAFWGGNQLHVFLSQDWSLVVIPVPAGGLDQARAIAEAAIARL